MKDHYSVPSDIKQLGRIYPVNKRAFSCKLIESRIHLMDEKTKARARKTIYCLQTGEAWSVRVQL